MSTPSQPADPAADKLRVLVLRGGQASANELLRISQWCHLVEDPPLKGRVRREPCPVGIEAALAIVRADRQRTVLLTLGIDELDVLRALRPIVNAALEVLVETPRAPAGSMPTASLFHRGPHLFSGDPTPHLRKSLLRLASRSAVGVRRIAHPEEFRQYFELRHRVWSGLNYIPEERRTERVRWEIDYADQTAVPIGAFSHDGQIRGCVRLVHEMGRQTPSIDTIRRLIADADDARLRGNLSYPPRISHPFDVLASIPGFHTYYRGLVRNGVSKAEISRVIVDPEFQGRGLGEVLVDSAIHVAHESEIDVLFLACAERHERFYARCGFEKLEGPTMRCDQFINVNAPAIVMNRIRRPGGGSPRNA